MAPPHRPLVPLLFLLASAASLALALASPTAPPASAPPNFSQKLGGRPRRPAQIGTSLVQTSLWDFEGDAGNGKTTCEVVVDRSKGYNTKALAIVLTVEARGYETAGLDQYFYKGEFCLGVFSSCSPPRRTGRNATRHTPTAQKNGVLHDGREERRRHPRAPPATRQPAKTHPRKHLKTNTRDKTTTTTNQSTKNKKTKTKTKEASGAWSPTTPQNIERYTKGLERCAKYAVSNGFTTLHLLPHVDPQEPSGKGLWRNTVKFDPTKRVGPSEEASSYEEAALLPAAKALGAAAASVPNGEKLSVDFSLGGEQGFSVFSYPRNYQAMVPRLKQAMLEAAGAASAGASGDDVASKKLKAEFGVSLNWGKACGCIEVTEQDPLIYNSTFPDRLARWRKGGGESKVDLGGVRALIEGLDWLGTSGYASMPPDAGAGSDANARGAAALEASWETLAYEMGLMGIPLQDIVLNKGKRMIFSEQGVGGCDRKGNVAPDAAWVAKHPFLGLWPNHGGYSSSEAANGAPIVNPWKNAQFADLRRQIYNFLGDYLISGGGPGYRLDAAYVWSAGEFFLMRSLVFGRVGPGGRAGGARSLFSLSRPLPNNTKPKLKKTGTWDVHGAHPVSGGGGSFNAGPLSYGDAEIQDKIRRVNAVANAAGSYSVAAPSGVSASERNAGAQAAIEAARAPIRGTKASSEAWAQAARAAAGVPSPSGAASVGSEGGGDKAAANNKPATANNSSNNKPAAAADNSSSNKSANSSNKPTAAANNKPAASKNAPAAAANNGSRNSGSSGSRNNSNNNSNKSSNSATKKSPNKITGPRNASAAEQQTPPPRDAEAGRRAASG